jgi:sulfane dehydrogenase subunit SoxC
MCGAASGGFYEISGLAWSGKGRVTKVDVSADGRKSWAPAALQGPVLPIAVTRFRMAWQWDGGPATLQSRATDADLGTSEDSP